MPRLVLAHDRVGPPTGMGKVVECMARTAWSDGWDVTLVSAEVTARVPASVNVVEVPVRRSLPGVVRHLDWVFRARRALSDLPNADLVHVHSPHLAAVADMMTCHHLAQASYQRGTRADGRGVAGPIRRAQHEVAWRIDRRRYRVIDRSKLSFVSPFLADEFERVYGPLDRRVVLPPPAPGWDPPSHEERSRARDRFGIADDVVAVAFFGGADPRKGSSRIRSLVEREGIALLAAGHGTEHLSWARGGGLGYVEPATVLAACDVVVVPSLFDAAPVIVLEAAAADRPVIVTPANGWAAPLVDHGAGLVWNEGDDLELLVRRAAQLPATCRREFAAAYGETEFGLKLIEEYEHVLSSGGS